MKFRNVFVACLIACGMIGGAQRARCQSVNTDSVARALMTAGEQFYENGANDSAIEAYRGVLALQPGTPHAIMRLGESYLLTGQYDSATIYLRAAISNHCVDSGAPSLLVDLGWAFYMLKDYPGAIQAYKDRLEEEPNDAEARGHLGQVYLQMHDHVSAVRELQKACMHRAEDSLRCRDLEIAVSNWCVDLAAKNDFDSIASVTSEMLGKNYVYADICYWRGEALLRHDSADAAMGMYRMAATLRPGDPFPFMGIGRAFQAKGLFARAAKEGFQKAVALDSTSAYAYASLGYCLNEAKQYKQAAAALEKALALNPEDTGSRYNLVMVYLELGNMPGACTHYLTLRTKAPDSASELAPRMRCK